MRGMRISALALGFVVVAASGAGGASGGTRPAGSRLAGLGWLAGSWASDSAGTRIEEHWTAPRGGMMLGVHRDVISGRRTSFEFFRIVEDTSGVRYVAQPGGRPPTSFPLKELGARRVVFEDLGHDFPQRIIYWLDSSGALWARTEGMISGKLESEEWRWKKSALAP